MSDPNNSILVMESVMQVISKAFFLCRLNARLNKTTGLWYVTTLRELHIHPPTPEIILSFQNRNKDLTDDKKEFMILFDKLDRRESNLQHVCTCGCSIRCGVWAVLRSTTTATIHEGLVNDLWFRKAQPLNKHTIKLHTYIPTITLQTQQS